MPWLQNTCANLPPKILAQVRLFSTNFSLVYSTTSICLAFLCTNLIDARIGGTTQLKQRGQTITNSDKKRIAKEAPDAHRKLRAQLAWHRHSEVGLL